VDIELLKTFLAVHRTGHFGQAADRLFITQSAVSARIRLLEETLGLQVFTRKRNDIRLTPAGNRLLKHAETIVNAWQRARQDTGLDEDYTASLAVGALFDLWHILLQDWLYRLRREMPGVALIAEAHPTEGLVRRMLDGVLDVAFVFEPPQFPELMVKEVAAVNLVMVSTEPDRSVPEALAGDYVMVDWGASFARSHSKLFPDMRTPAVRMGLGSLALDFLRCCGGSGYLPERMVAEPLQRGELHPVNGAPAVERFAYALYRSDSERDVLIRKALGHL